MKGKVMEDIQQSEYESIQRIRRIEQILIHLLEGTVKDRAIRFMELGGPGTDDQDMELIRLWHDLKNNPT